MATPFDEKKVAAAQDEIRALQRKASELDSQAQELPKEIKKLEIHVEKEIPQEISELQNKLRLLERERDASKDKLSQDKSNLSRIMRESKDTATRFKKVQEEVKQFNREVQEKKPA